MITKGYGFSVEDIGWSCPKDLNPYVLANKQEQIQRDSEMWAMGGYIVQSLKVAVTNMFLKENSKPYVYPEKPYLSADVRTELTEAEKAKKTEELFGMLEIMQHNFELSEKENG